MPRRAVDPQAVQDAVAAVSAWLDDETRKPARTELAAAVRQTLWVLERVAPGHSVEVRVPPFAAIQCVAGPRHTRGTPPNIIETDPRTWLLLATGEWSWAEALTQGRVTASGSRADIGQWLPLVRRHTVEGGESDQRE
jgi:hypothetical protein